MTLSQNDTPPNESGFPTMPNLSAVADAFKALDDETRLRIFWLLRDGEKSVGEIAALMKMSCPAVCHHLNADQPPRRQRGLLYKSANDANESALSDDRRVDKTRFGDIRFFASLKNGSFT